MNPCPECNGRGHFVPYDPCGDWSALRCADCRGTGRAAAPFVAHDVATLMAAAVTLGAYAQTSMACGNAAGRATARLSDQVTDLAQRMADFLADGAR